MFGTKECHEQQKKKIYVTCECNRLLVPSPNTKNIFYCKKCDRLWRFIEHDNQLKAPIIIDYLHELEEVEKSKTTKKRKKSNDTKKSRGTRRSQR